MSRIADPTSPDDFDTLASEGEEPRRGLRRLMPFLPKSMTTHSKYVVGFMFDEACQRVALIQKSKPAWQRGLLNGIGGKIEDFDVSIEIAMAREFKEETGLETLPESWTHYASMVGSDWSVACLYATGKLELLRSNEAEPVIIEPLQNDGYTRLGAIEGLSWLIALAIDSMRDGRPHFTTIQYR